jgi:FecR protein/Putative zinc-finger
MKRSICLMEPLVEARRDGRLGEAEIASVGRHLATCASCAELAADLDDVGALLRTREPALSALEHRRGRVRLLREVALPPAAAEAELRPRRLRRVAVIVAAALSIAAAILGARAIGRAEGLARPLSLNHLPAALRAAPSRPVTLIESSEGARFIRAMIDGADVVTLDEGAVKLWVRPLLPGERLLVKTADAEVEVHGTIFRVEAARGEVQSIDVMEGTVEVRFRAKAIALVAGEHWARPREQTASDLAPASPIASPPAIARAPRAAAPSARVASKGGGSKSDTKSDGSKGDVKDDASKEFADAVSAADQGDFGAAASRLDAFSRAHAGDQRAEDAAFLAVVSLQRAGRQAEAREAARRYLSRFPAGYRRAEAAAIAGAP